MKFTVSLFLPFIAAVVATPTASPDESALDARAPSPPPGCNFVIECNTSDICQGFECADVGYFCDGATLTLEAGSAANATCTNDCSCELFCGVGPHVPELGRDASTLIPQLVRKLWLCIDRLCLVGLYAAIARQLMPLLVPKRGAPVVHPPAGQQRFREAIWVLCNLFVWAV
ncbi:hypothetical protein C8R44DRAFT_940990 [Mycena epipterygia]|nr:hypothetical protein C8R44DRAFT_940990 [Mycena epipterygia]